MQLLMRDGAIRVAFHPHLTMEQYGELLALAQRTTSVSELRRELTAASQRWGREVEFDK